jgi:altronate dehydratase large subunit
MSDTILGYQRPDGQVGIRNKVAVIYTVGCSKLVANRIAANFEDAQVFGRRNGCHEWNPLFQKFVALATHPNTASTLLVGLGCEFNDAPALMEAIRKHGRRAEYVQITECGGTIKTIEAGRKILQELIEEAKKVPRVSIKTSDLVVAMDCAGSDATSGLASNPATGVASDLLVEQGATVYCFNVDQELVGMEEAYVSRAANEKAANQLRAVMPHVDAPTPSKGNQDGGITTAREKAIGAFAKAGKSPFEGVVKTFEKPTKPGLYLEVMVPGSFEDYSDPQCAMNMAACGAHIVVETTGVGTVTGGVVAATMKVCANPKTCSMLGDEMDIDASAIMTGEKTIDEVGRELYEEILEIAGGKETRSEIFGHFED